MKNEDISYLISEFFKKNLSLKKRSKIIKK